MADYKDGDTVKWNWSGSTASGTVKKKYTGKITRKIKGTEVTRNASEDDPAYLIEKDDGDEVLKSGSELSKA
ncbi:DUF2945 domain-containing protein [Pseudoroseicyclus aestuarii]|uniref:Hypervirulence associated protein TUDOR domain-containing protein n=1 Tax=Pseudoroseicyclus aestuarii TaxID=1795041 RepID=A0A318SSG2_9RHOB|nr:DUF2945 domain-containing protein [Pseudoroseicyclus aestuarii]PYE84315.1 hypothetical protein DFP88_102112 [Pseudoroseicyclus aestuarii]